MADNPVLTRRQTTTGGAPCGLSYTTGSPGQGGHRVRLGATQMEEAGREGHEAMLSSRKTSVASGGRSRTRDAG